VDILWNNNVWNLDPIQVRVVQTFRAFWWPCQARLMAVRDDVMDACVKAVV
jgi:hypothetical protein